VIPSWPVWNARQRRLLRCDKEINVTKHPEGEVRKTVRPVVVPVRPNFLVDLTMTSDRPCISERGFMVHAGVKVIYLGHIGTRAVRVRMEDGSEEIVHPHCFPELR
jgi:hypothetical protein